MVLYPEHLAAKSLIAVQNTVNNCFKYLISIAWQHIQHSRDRSFLRFNLTLLINFA